MSLLITATSADSAQPGGIPGGAQPPQPPVREIEVTAERFRFIPDLIEVTQGERLRLIVKSADWTHGVEIKAFDVRKEIPKGGESVVIEFVAERAGTFEIACSEYCGKDHSKMKGKLIVKPEQEGKQP